MLPTSFCDDRAAFKPVVFFVAGSLPAAALLCLLRLTLLAGDALGAVPGFTGCLGCLASFVLPFGIEVLALVKDACAVVALIAVCNSKGLPAWICRIYTIANRMCLHQHFCRLGVRHGPTLA